MRIQFDGTEGELETPATKDKTGGVVLVQEYWGVNDHVRDIGKRLAAEGFRVLAPDLYHGKVTKSAEEAGKLMGSLDWPKALAEIVAAAEHLRDHETSNGKVAVMGFCMGGALTFAAAANIPWLAAAVPFYGIPNEKLADYTKEKAPILAHFAQERSVGDRRQGQGDPIEGRGDGAPRLRRAARVLQRHAARGLQPPRREDGVGALDRVLEEASVLRRAALLIFVVACQSQQSTAAVTLSAPSSSVTIATPPATTATTRLCGRTDAPRVAPDVAALIAKKTTGASYEFPAMPSPPVEVVEGAAAELRDASVRRAFEKLDTDAIEELRKANAKWTLAAALGSSDIDVRIRAARALQRLRDPAPASYMVEIARATAVFVPGSEAATLQNMFMHAIADATGECAAVKIAIKDGQDPEGLKAAADAWKKKLCP